MVPKSKHIWTRIYKQSENFMTGKSAAAVIACFVMKYETCALVVDVC